MTSARERLALAADLPLADCERLYEQVRGEVGYVKVGLSLFVEHGPAAVKAFTSRGAKVFLDLKLHDIPNTVRLAAEKAGALGVGLLTVHASGGRAMLEAAMEGVRTGAARAGCPAPRVLAVTVLTSLSDAELEAVGVGDGASRQVSRLAELAHAAGVDGLVCSPLELAALRERFGRGLFLCTPGIRPSGSAAGDQSRTETPAAAVRAGADLLVVGRPIYGDAQPLAAAQRLVREIDSALAG